MIAPALSYNTIVRNIPLADSWEMATSVEPATSEKFRGLRFIPAQVPGTVASTLRAHGAWKFGDATRFDAAEHWFRCRFDAEPAEAGERIMLSLGGIATIACVWLNGEEILNSDSMFTAHQVDVTSLVRDRNELSIVCRPLAQALRERRRAQPALRWRTRVVAEQQLRWFRTTLLGRAPGFAREPEPVGPWRPVTLIRERLISVEQISRHVKLNGSDGIVSLRITAAALISGLQPPSGRLVVGELSAPVEWEQVGDRSHGTAMLRIPNVKCWWPHTHGDPALYPVRIELELAGERTRIIEDLPIGFHEIHPGVEPAGDAGLNLHVNGIPVFCRGVVWTPCDLVSLNARPDAVRTRLQSLRNAGFNLIRLAGTMVYEDEAFHCLCDELGLMVWQDMMFANMDYPFEDAAFSRTACAEAETELARLSRHPSTAVICGNSEIEQQVGMLGLDPKMGRGTFFAETLPAIAAAHCPVVPYIPSAPCGGDMPFRTRSGIANYFGVGAYLRPIEDARRAEVRFASECLAFSNVPEPETIDEMALAIPGISPTHPLWKRGVPRDSGAGWDFEDVRDHYLKLLYSVDPLALRYANVHRYWELSRMASGEVMAEVFGEWRRADSPCGGGVILWCADFEPGAGWGILDSSGRPKSGYWFLKRALAPRAVWTTDEGLNGVDVHVANDAPSPLECLLRIAVYRDGQQRIAQVEKSIDIAPHVSQSFGVEQALGRFVDASYAFRFGPPGHDVISVALYQSGTDIPFAQSFGFPAGRTTQRLPISELGLAGEARVLPDGRIDLLLTTRRFAWGVQVAVPGFFPDDSYFGIEPYGKRRVILVCNKPGRLPATVTVSAVNADGRLAVPIAGIA